MAHSRVLVISDETSEPDYIRQLEVFINTKDRVYMKVGFFDEEDGWGFVTLNKEDAAELGKELINLSKQM